MDAEMALKMKTHIVNYYDGYHHGPKDIRKPEYNCGIMNNYMKKASSNVLSLLGIDDNSNVSESINNLSEEELSELMELRDINLKGLIHKDIKHCNHNLLEMVIPCFFIKDQEVFFTGVVPDICVLTKKTALKYIEILFEKMSSHPSFDFISGSILMDILVHFKIPNEDFNMIYTEFGSHMRSGIITSLLNFISSKQLVDFLFKENTTLTESMLNSLCEYDAEYHNSYLRGWRAIARRVGDEIYFFLPI